MTLLAIAEISKSRRNDSQVQFQLTVSPAMARLMRAVWWQWEWRPMLMYTVISREFPLAQQNSHGIPASSDSRAYWNYSVFEI